MSLKLKENNINGITLDNPQDSFIQKILDKNNQDLIDRNEVTIKLEDEEQNLLDKIISDHKMLKQIPNKFKNKEFYIKACIKNIKCLSVIPAYLKSDKFYLVNIWASWCIPCRE